MRALLFKQHYNNTNRKLKRVLIKQKKKNPTQLSWNPLLI